MVRIVRRTGIAIGSLVAAMLVVGLVAGPVLFAAGLPYGPVDPDAPVAASALKGFATIVLGGLIYRDILRRDLPAH